MGTRWLLRTGTRRSGFRYEDASGAVIRDERVLSRIEGLRIPPAWRHVHIAADPRRSIQAWGTDARGRKQYRYHARAVERRELRKYYRVRKLARRLPEIRATVRRISRRDRFSRAAAAATVLRLICDTCCRVGGERYLAENGTYGITTIRKRHVSVERGQAILRYPGKRGILQRQVIVDPELIGLIRQYMRTPGPRLFRFRAAEGWRDLGAPDVLRLVREHAGAGFCPKDFRTWGGTLKAAIVLAELGPARSATEAKRNVALAMRLVSAELGNTPVICRKSYVHPMLIARYLDEGETIAARQHRRRRAATMHSADERALIAFLDRHFPERRREERLGEEEHHRAA